jgi:hypothetical protein
MALHRLGWFCAVQRVSLDANGEEGGERTPRPPPRFVPIVLDGDPEKGNFLGQGTNASFAAFANATGHDFGEGLFDGFSDDFKDGINGNAVSVRLASPSPRECLRLGNRRSAPRAPCCEGSFPPRGEATVRVDRRSDRHQALAPKAGAGRHSTR